jgi:hypothetical protein
VVSTEDGLCAVAAVLLKLRRDWLGQHPEREEWCVTQVVNTVLNPPARHEFDSEVSVSTLGWDSFCAEVAPLLWAEDPQSPVLRECVARLVMNYHYATVAILFARAAGIREKLGDDFGRLQHFMLRWAAMRWNLTRFRYPDDPDARQAELDDWVSKEVTEFVAGSLPAQLPSWLEVIGEEREPEADPIADLTGIRRKATGPRLDLEVIKAAYAWLPPLGQARTEVERAEWLRFWEEALACSLRMIDDRRKEDGDVSGTPYPWDGWVFYGVARSIAECRSDERPERLWQPVLDLGAGAHYWIERFFREWFRICAETGSCRECFLREWRSMVEFAFLSSRWAFEPAGRSWDVREMWRDLLGLNQLVSYVWTTERKPIIAQMRDLFQRWASSALAEARSVVAFARFLQQPAARPILLDGLIWIAKSTAAADEWFWQERYLDGTVASLLDHCWSTSQPDVRRSADTLGAFNELLKRTADRQNPVALELLDRVARDVLSSAGN